jgi:CRP-like cAMP-binding protein
MSMRQAARQPRGNRLLDALSAHQRARIEDDLEEVRLELLEPLFGSGEPIDSVYFPTESVVSLLTRASGSSGVEVATIGNEGIAGLSLSWGADTLNPAEFFQVQVPGRAFRMNAGAFVTALNSTEELAEIIRRYTQAFVSQLCQQVACNGLHSIGERCARWLLLTHDRVGGDTFLLTQDFLAQMLGVRRPSVSAVAGQLQQAGYIHYRRGRVTITDRIGLEQAACECYQVLREVFDRLMA